MIHDRHRRTDIRLHIINAVPLEDRCPHLKYEEGKIFCGNEYKEGSPIQDGRRMVCDQDSLQLFCLDNYKGCNWYKQPNF